MNKSGGPGTALITGASSGIGYELARVFAKNGHPLVLVARNAEKLTQLAAELGKKYSLPVKVIPKDLSKDASPGEIYETVKKEKIAIEILVNNAAFGTLGPFAESRLSEQLEMVQLNIGALTALTRRFLPDMIRCGRGKILNVASTAAFQPGPLMAVYYATKAYVLSFSEAVANEVEGTGVTVTVLCPGATQTEFQKRANLQGIFLTKNGVMMDAKKVAEIGYRGLMRNKTLVIPGYVNKITPFLVRFSPRKLVSRVVRLLHEKK